MKAYINNLFSLALLLSFLMLQGCSATTTTMLVPPPIQDGQVVGVHPGTVIYGLNQVLRGAGGSEVLVSSNGKNIMFSWGNGGYEGVKYWWNYSSSRDILTCTGNVACYNTYTELKEALKDLGWRVMTPPEYKPIIVAVLSILAKSSQGLTTPVFIVIPEGSPLNTEPIPQ